MNTSILKGLAVSSANYGISMSKYSQHKALIESIFNDTGKSKRDAENLTNSLTRLTGDLYTETERFIFELLQNADDLPNEHRKVTVKFILLEKHLLILHNGQPFNEENVDAICKISESTKSNNPEQTGYKGIGFKSVFTDSECVYINSGNFSFKFDRHDSRHRKLEKTPWQIKPLWVESQEYPQEIQNCADFFQAPVATALRVTENQISEYKQKIKRLFNDPRLILFLRHVSLIYVYGLNKSYSLNTNPCIKIEKVRQEDTYQVIQNNIKTQWLIKDYEFSVGQELREAMDNDKKVPDKLKSIQKSKLSFAAEIKDGKITPTRNSVLFTYLPTDVKEYKFPFLVNADFLTTANRQSIHVDNVWNQFIFEKIGKLIFQWIADLAKHENYQDFILAILPNKFRYPTTGIEKQFNQGFNQGIETIPFIRAEEVSDLLTAKESIIDETNIISLVYEENILQYLQWTNYHFVSNSLENIQKLKNLRSVSIFTDEKLSDFGSSRVSMIN